MPQDAEEVQAIMVDLTGKTALITGGARGTGLAIAKKVMTD